MESPDCKMLSCGFCDNKFCVKCIGMAESEYAGLVALSGRTDAFWLCKGCMKSMSKIRLKYQSSVFHSLYY